jgi:hypothetical protein
VTLLLACALRAATTEAGMIVTIHEGGEPTFLEELERQRRDDHRYYHQSRINQTLHLFSAICFLVTYAMVFWSPAYAAVFGWVIAMVSRQMGHFFFEPKGYDAANGTSYETKERIKVGYNQRLKVILLIAWGLVPVALAFSPTFFGVLPPYAGAAGFLHHLGLVWFALAIMGLTARTLYLCLTRSVRTGLVWALKIFTDPFHNIRIYYRSPLYLLRGQLLDPLDGLGQPTSAH